MLCIYGCDDGSVGVYMNEYVYVCGCDNEYVNVCISGEIGKIWGLCGEVCICICICIYICICGAEP